MPKASRSAGLASTARAEVSPRSSPVRSSAGLHGGIHTPGKEEGSRCWTACGDPRPVGGRGLPDVAAQRDRRPNPNCHSRFLARGCPPLAPGSRARKGVDPLGPTDGIRCESPRGVLTRRGQAGRRPVRSRNQHQTHPSLSPPSNHTPLAVAGDLVGAARSARRAEGQRGSLTIGRRHGSCAVGRGPATPAGASSTAHVWQVRWPDRRPADRCSIRSNHHRDHQPSQPPPATAGRTDATCLSAADGPTSPLQVTPRARRIGCACRTSGSRRRELDAHTLAQPLRRPHQPVRSSREGQVIKVHADIVACGPQRLCTEGASSGSAGCRSRRPRRDSNSAHSSTSTAYAAAPISAVSSTP